ncbi:MAG: hypothetical protein AAGA31_20715, partial [Bacteroidota bacterium]
MRSILFFVGLLISCSSYAHNGKVSYALPNSIIIDGETSDWKEVKHSISLGDKLEDFSGELKLAYDPDEEYLFISVEIFDDYLSPEDVL